MPRLGVNIDHVATLRQVRGGREPDPVWAAVAGRTGRRRRDHHPPPRGPPAYPGPRPPPPAADRPGPPQPGAGGRAGDRRDRLGMRPDQVTFVPEHREELTTEGGLDVVGQRDRVAAAVQRCRDAGMEVACSSIPTPGKSRGRRAGGGGGRAAHRALRRAPEGPGGTGELEALKAAPPPPSPPDSSFTPATASITRMSARLRGSTAWKS